MTVVFFSVAAVSGRPLFFGTIFDGRRPPLQKKKNAASFSRRVFS
jgi:hypothetical protein